jgi:HlyD family secretion protein
MWKRKIARVSWQLAILLIVAGAVFYRLRLAPVEVQAQAAKVGLIVHEVTGTGTLQARVQASVSPRIAERIDQVHTDEGQRVTRGQLLVTLDDGELRRQVEIAQAELVAIQITVRRNKAEVQRAQALASLARTELERLQALQKSGATSPYELDRAVQQHQVAEAEFHRAELAEAESQQQVVAAQARLEYYRERLQDTRIVSPFDGLVTRRSREPGDVLVPGGELLQIIALDQMWVSAWIDETVLALVAPQQSVRVVFRSEPERSYAGTVTRVAPLADAETREVQVDVTVPELPAAWAVGQRAEVYIAVARKSDALLAPAAAIAWRGGEPGAFVARGGSARWQALKLGLQSRQMVEVVAGLREGDQVVWKSQAHGPALSDGRAVKLP